MTPTAEYEPELVDALNLLIEDERASVEMEVALTSGATEYAEREALARMGIDDIGACERLRAEMESAGLPVTPQINGVVFEVLGAERYDDRLRSFAHHQRIVADRAGELLQSNLDGELRDALVAIMASHQRHIEWANHRAGEFAATRLLEFGPRPLAESAATTLPGLPEVVAATPPAETLLTAFPSGVPMEGASPAEAPVEAPEASPEETPELVAEPAQPARTTKIVRKAGTAKTAKTTKTTRTTKAAALTKGAKTTRTAKAGQIESPTPRRGRPRKVAQPSE